MKTRKKLNKKEISFINERYVKGYDKWYRMMAGCGSTLLNYENGIIYIEFNNNRKAIPTNYTRMVQFANNWKNYNKELNDAVGFVVFCNTTDKATGFAFKAKALDNKELIENTLKELRREPNKRLEKIFSGIFTPDLEVISQTGINNKKDRINTSVKLPTPFYFIVIQSQSIEENYPYGFEKFNKDFNIESYNKDITVLSFMAVQYRDNFISEVVAKMKLNRHEHFAVGEEALYYGVEGKVTSIEDPIVDPVDWLNTYNLPEGNFVEYKKS